jgi:hypothetical protein
LVSGTTINSGENLVLNISNAENGYVILRYVPYNLSFAKYGNVTYVVLFIGSFEYDDFGNLVIESCSTSCNIIGNSDFEGAPSDCFAFDSWRDNMDAITCWQPLTATPELLMDESTCDVCDDDDELADSSIRLRANLTPLWEESVRQPLNVVLEPGNYVLAFNYLSTSHCTFKVKYSDGFLPYYGVLPYSQISEEQAVNWLEADIEPTTDCNWQTEQIAFTIESDESTTPDPFFIGFIAIGVTYVEGQPDGYMNIDNLVIYRTDIDPQGVDLSFQVCDNQTIDLEGYTGLVNATFTQSTGEEIVFIDLNEVDLDEIELDYVQTSFDGCQTFGTVTFHLIEHSELEVIVDNMEFCDGDEVQLTIEEPGEYIWTINGLPIEGTSNTITVVAPAPQFLFDVQLAEFSCINQSGEVISEITTELISSDEDFSICGTGPMVLSINDPLEINWSYIDDNGNPVSSNEDLISISSTSPIVLEVYGKNEFGCTFMFQQMLDFIVSLPRFYAITILTTRYSFPQLEMAV